MTDGVPNSFSVWTIHTVSLPVQFMVVFAVHHSELLDIQAGHVTPLAVKLGLDQVGLFRLQLFVEQMVIILNVPPGKVALLEIPHWYIGRHAVLFISELALPTVLRV